MSSWSYGKGHFVLHVLALVIAGFMQTAAAYKPNIAFFEALGPEGWKALGEVVGLIPPDIPVLLDAKRGDISTTAEAYATAALEAR